MYKDLILYRNYFIIIVKTNPVSSTDRNMFDDIK